MRQLKARMLERARAIYRDEGIAALTMRRMAEEFGLSTMAMYSYFRNKEALLSGLWVEAFEALVEQLLLAAAGRRAPLKILEAHLRTLFDFWEQRADLYRLVYLSAAQSSGGGDLVDMAQQPAYAQLLLLTRERVAACLGGPDEPSEALLRLQTDLMVAKLLGFLQLSLGVARYPLADRDALREQMLRDMLSTVSAGAAMKQSPA
jgi:AcrR family transcriptional regulator